MLRTALSLLALPAITAAISLAEPTPALAQRGGGHGGGGFHGGGFHGGGFGGYHSGFAGGYHSGYRPLGGYSGYHPYGSGYHPYYYGQGYHPYYSGYGFYPYYSGAYPDSGSYLNYGSGYAESPAQVTPIDPDNGTGVAPQVLDLSPSAPSDSPANLTVNVPADAEIWLGETKMASTGSVRVFYSPPLTPGRQYTYDIRAHWKDNGRDITQTQNVDVTAGGDLHVTFPLPSVAAASAKANPAH
jgi:uncharacterized protein (TIGR03000 family)